MPLRGSPGPVGAAVHSWAPECAGGHPQLSVTGPGVGMDPLFSGLQGPPPSVANYYRPVRHILEPSPSRLLLADGRSAVGRHRCDDAAVGWTLGLCLPSLWPSPVRRREGPAISGVGAHICGSVLASVPLVSGPSGASGGCPSVPSTSEGSTQTATLPSFPPELPCASADCVSYIERSARTFGFSSEVARQLARYRHSSTRVNYQAKWAVYRAWCTRHGHSVTRPTVPKVASFLLYLCRSLSLFYSSIASYHSMLSVVVRFVLPEFSSHFVLRDLLRSFRLERPLSSSCVPPWDLSLVLFFFCGVLPLNPSLLALFATLPGRSSFCFLSPPLVELGSFRLCLLRCRLRGMTCFCLTCLSFRRRRSPRFVLSLALFRYALFAILWALFLMNFSCVWSVRFASACPVLLLFLLVLVPSLSLLVLLLTLSLRML